MITVKVLTGPVLDLDISTRKMNEFKNLMSDNWEVVIIDSDLHPSEIVKQVDDLVLDESKPIDRKIVIQTNCDHVFNRLRVLRKLRKIDKVEFIHFFKLNGEISREIVIVDSNGECSQYPEGFLDEWPKQIGELV